MDLIKTLHKLALVMERTNVFIDANAGLLPEHKSKLIDIATISLMHYEDHVFHYDQLKNIVSAMVEKRMAGKTQWFVDISASTSHKIVVKSSVDDMIYIMPVEVFMLSAQLAAH